MRKAIALLVATLVLLAAPVWGRSDVVLIAGFGDGGDFVGGGTSVEHSENGAESQS